MPTHCEDSGGKLLRFFVALIVPLRLVEILHGEQLANEIPQ